MSLLNDMLTDLAKQQQPFQGKALLAEHLQKAGDHFINWRMPICLLFIMVFFLVFGWYWFSLEARPKPLIQALKSHASQTVSHERAQEITMSLQSHIQSLDDYITHWVPIEEENKPTEEAQAGEETVLWQDSPDDSLAQTAEELADKMSNPTSLNKVYLPPSLVEWKATQMDLAVKAVDEGADAQAIEILKNVLLKAPADVDVRENLASVYLSQGKVDAANLIISKGLEYAPEAPSLLTIKARVLLAQSNVQSALQLLTTYRPSMHKYPDYYATLAALLQSVGRSNESSMVYKSLLKVDPKNGQYWLGYAMALEQNKQMDEAKFAYARASQSPDSELAIRSYAENRLSSLKG